MKEKEAAAGGARTRIEERAGEGDSSVIYKINKAERRR
jgi:hypothetical protein